MTQPAQAALPLPALLPARLRALGPVLLRYGLSTLGPLAVSGAHFLASLVFLRNLSAAEFGTFSFVLVVGAFAMSIAGAGLVLPATHSMVRKDHATTRAVFKLALLVGLFFAAGLVLVVMASGTSFAVALPLGGFGAALSYRWFLRSLAYIEGRVLPAIFSDLIYGGIVVAGLGMMVLTHNVSLRGGGLLLLAAALASLMTFRGAAFRLQRQALGAGKLRDYLPVFRDITGWSLLGVALTELTLNAHAYLVTFIAGPSAFALPALGMLLMRPVSLVQSALPDLERPAMMRAFAAGDGIKLGRSLKHFQGALALVLAGTILLAGALLLWAPQLLLKRGYALSDVMLAGALCAAIMAVRSVRTPLAVLLQAAGQFKALARLGGYSAAVSIAATLVLLLTLGPIASLGGILMGDLVILACIWPLAQAARRLHG